MSPVYHFYIIQSSNSGKCYKGHTGDVETRLHQHNLGKCRSTRNDVPWVLLYSESFPTRLEAIEREKFYKTLQGGKGLAQKLDAV